MHHGDIYIFVFLTNKCHEIYQSPSTSLRPGPNWCDMSLQHIYIHVIYTFPRNNFILESYDNLKMQF